MLNCVVGGKSRQLPENFKEGARITFVLEDKFNEYASRAELRCDRQVCISMVRMRIGGHVAATGKIFAKSALSFTSFML